ncbi:hypothetical protein GCM10007987_31490 [Aliivibrio fischeri]|nr:hypothetical protein GCM10007987_31490 [Aliivibrio fischeri]
MTLEEHSNDYFIAKTRTYDDRSSCWTNDSANDVLIYIQISSYKKTDANASVFLYLKYSA